ncbi:ArpU family phage packaging/lysis transcriptional regulator [Metabacillus litoralis]|uniref:ArpU family phage packaging/lysis transcriptional regulator n=1 Tax=Metabacillus litoralis TaxID=152268 RepID=UPI0020408C69|nr:ArpU family phage packaging/lysis transcriptional regulator [Metabacillus litoralis]MCM3165113.1 hypothetical protein [Metabacillus litoralis]
MDLPQIKEKVAKEFEQYKILKVKTENFEHTLSALDEIEREIIHRKYLVSQPDKDITIYMDLGIKKNVFYSKKNSAHKKIADVLGLIKEEGYK